MKVYFVRHGETNYNVLNLCNDDPTKDVHLTQKGKQQAVKVKDQLKDITFDVVYTSPLPRTKETAQIILEGKTVLHITEPRIHDRKTGFESKSVDLFMQAMQEDPFTTKVGIGESFLEEKQRVFSFLEELSKSFYTNVLVVCHSEIMKIIKGYYEKLTNEQMWNLEVLNCEVYEVDLNNLKSLH